MYPPKINLTDQFYALFVSTNPIKIMNRVFDRLGDTYGIQSILAPNDFIFTKDPKLTEHFLRKNHRMYEKSNFQTEVLSKYIGKGLLTNTGESWKKQRRLIQPGFSHSKIESLTEVIKDEVHKNFESVPQNVPFDLYEFYNKLAFNVVAKSLFTTDIGEEKINYVARTITAAQEYFIKETRHPGYKIYFELFGKIKGMKKEMQKVRQIFQELINERRRAESSFDDLLDMMLNITYEDTGKGMDDEQLIDELLILFIAGHETTANTLSFTTYLLGKNPDEAERIRGFIQGLEDKYAIESLVKPSPVQNAINESMRLFPPVWILDRQALADDHFEGFTWKKDTIIIANILGMNRDEKRWERANEFIPSRFNQPETKEKLFIPFGSGPRYCIGEHFARIEMSIVLIHLLSEYEIELVQDEIKILPYVTLRPEKVIAMVKK